MVYEPILTLIKNIVTKIKVFGKILGTSVVSVPSKSYNQLKFLNLVTMATNKIALTLFLDANKEGRYKDIGFWKLFRAAVVSMTRKSYNQLIYS